MTTCSSSSDDPDFTSTSDVEDDVDHSAIDELSLGHVHESDDVNRSSLELKTAKSRCDDDIDADYTAHSSDSRQHIIEADTGCNGILAEAKYEVKCGTSSSPPEMTSDKLDDSAVVCPANGLVSEIPATSAVKCVMTSYSSAADRSDESQDNVTTDALVSKPVSDADCTSCTVNTELKPSLTNSIPLLSIPQTYRSCSDDNSFSILPSLSLTTEDMTVQVKPPSVFSVPCTGKDSDCFTDVNLDDDVEPSKSPNTLSVQHAVSAESSGDSSPSRLRLATTSSSLQIDDAIVQSVLCDDEDDDTSRTVGSSRQSTSSIAFATNTDSAAFQTPACPDSSAVPLKDDGLHVVEPDSASFEEISLHSSNTLEFRDVDPEPAAASESKRSSLANFFARSLLFSRKGHTDHRSAEGASDVPGWKLFGKIPPKLAPEKDPSDVSLEYMHTRRLETGVMPKPESSTKLMMNLTSVGGHVARRSEKEVPSTTALILEHRPDGLPSKSPDDIMRHQLMYDQMVEAARKKERKDAKVRKQRQEEQHRHEEQLCHALRVWNTEILPNWDLCKASKKTHDLWWYGLPPSVRGRVWKLAIGNDLNVTSELYEICLIRARDKLKILQDAGTNSDTDSISSFTELSGNRESSVELIKLDVSRTFPQLCIFQQGGPYHQTLQGLLGAYACYRPDVGYVQGMSFIAAVLLLNMDDLHTFICFANLLNKPCEVAFFRLDENLMKAYFETYQLFFRDNLPQLSAHFSALHLTPDIYIIDWMFTLFAKSLPLDVASRVWDVFCRDGEEFLFRTALGILRMYEDILLRLDFIHLAQFLTRLPDNISCVELFDCIAQIRMTTTVDKLRFSQVFASFREQLSH